MSVAAEPGGEWEIAHPGAWACFQLAYKLRRRAPVQEMRVLDVQALPDDDREQAFRRHWAHRPPPQHTPLKEASADMRLVVERALLAIAERRRLAELEAEAERARLKEEGKGRAGKKKK